MLGLVGLLVEAVEGGRNSSYGFDASGRRRSLTGHGKLSPRSRTSLLGLKSAGNWHQRGGASAEKKRGEHPSWRWRFSSAEHLMKMPC